MMNDTFVVQSPITPSQLLSHFEHEESGIPLLYTCLPLERDPEKPTIVCVTGPSGSGKDTVMNPLVEDHVLSHAKTATSRRRRYKLSNPAQVEIDIDLAGSETQEEYERKLVEYANKGCFEELEPFNSYVWMRWKRDDESDEQYYEALIKEYQLVEHNAHYKGVYGLPISSLEEAVTSGMLPLLRIDINGIQHIRELLSEKFNIIVVSVIPDNWDQVANAIRDRESGEDVEAKVEARIREDKQTISRYPRLVNFIIQNHRGDVQGMDGKAYSTDILRMILRNGSHD